MPSRKRPRQRGLVTLSGWKREAEVRRWSGGPGEAQTPQADGANAAAIHVFYCHGMEAKQRKERSRNLAAVVRHSAHLDFTYRKSTRGFQQQPFLSRRRPSWARPMGVSAGFDLGAPVLEAEGRGWPPDNGFTLGALGRRRWTEGPPASPGRKRLPTGACRGVLRLAFRGCGVLACSINTWALALRDALGLGLPLR